MVRPVPTRLSCRALCFESGGVWSPVNLLSSDPLDPDGGLGPPVNRGSGQSGGVGPVEVRP